MRSYECEPIYEIIITTTTIISTQIMTLCLKVNTIDTIYYAFQLAHNFKQH